MSTNYRTAVVGSLKTCLMLFKWSNVPAGINFCLILHHFWYFQLVNQLEGFQNLAESSESALFKILHTTKPFLLSSAIAKRLPDNGFMGFYSIVPLRMFRRSSQSFTESFELAHQILYARLIKDIWVQFWSRTISQKLRSKVTSSTAVIEIQF